MSTRDVGTPALEKCVYGYRISGLNVTSDLSLPGLIATDAPDKTDIAIRAGFLADMLENAEDGGPNWQRSDTAFQIEVPDIVRMRMRGGRELTYAIARDASERDAGIFLTGTGFGILLHQRGQVLLHASAVRVGDTAVLFCGASGAGKSTLAAALGERGYPLVADDFCAVTSRDNRPWAEPDARQHKLWRHAIDRLGLELRRRDAVRSKLEKFHVAPRAASRVPLPIGAVYVLEEARLPIAAGIGQPNLADAVTLVRRNAYRPGLVRSMCQGHVYFEAAASIARSAGVYTLARRLDFTAMDEVIGWLEAHWRRLDLMEHAA